jgi:hypothetical protein
MPVRLQTTCATRNCRPSSDRSWAAQASTSSRGRLLMMEHIEYLSKIGRAGGSTKSKAKREAAQKNGELGGRPRLTTGTKDEKKRREQLREAQARRRAKLARQGE